jgi:type I restriction enzyme R subunit
VCNDLQLLKEKGIRVQGGDVLAKTIIFARDQTHAGFIVEVFDEMYPYHRGRFAGVFNQGGPCGPADR